MKGYAIQYKVGGHPCTLILEEEAAAKEAIRYAREVDPNAIYLGGVTLTLNYVQPIIPTTHH